ncbi:hypothetical protein BU15DRAFT_81961 [Melanogaster broomeanus]|nr:hypothetical protein BU15DRAFT_81961 [Melanogaster broomeanus]
MAEENTRGKRKTAEGSGAVQPSTSQATSDDSISKITVATSGPSHRATVRTEEEEAALHADDNIDATLETPDDDPEESSDGELVRLMKDWNSPIYAFYEPVPTIEYKNGPR